MTTQTKQDKRVKRALDRLGSLGGSRELYDSTLRLLDCNKWTRLPDCDHIKRAKDLLEFGAVDMHVEDLYSPNMTPRGSKLWFRLGGGEVEKLDSPPGSV